MRYYAARQRLDSQWDWTVMHDKVVTASHPCNGPEACNHKTKGEAEQHFYFDEIKKSKETVYDSSSLHKCEVEECGDYTHKALQTPRLFKILPVLLCDSHRNNNGLMLARPYNSGMQLSVS